ncbi:OB-fold domain-containing protein [Novosphingobium sp. KCTC 2891]|uniref:Zn-ribbon domain-containing OB-fold protein n=1 Tax=Novosphingobium sp. KCTC 2891 TaxID=2989730 RepID=UPI002221A370|nr:OB-fold domain-containing protein [Novosphingobium sp. KCTC 2891]MCW1384691.1 OB-fold domain-containing protein [Novosphingobium sp. KCTC 2891]
MTLPRIRPATWDRDTGPFFAAAAERRLVYKHCNACGRGNHVPTPSCRFCGSTDTAWREAEGKGTLYTWTTVTHPVHPAYPAPYTVVIVTLEAAPDVRLTGSVPGAPDLAPGQPMEVWFEDLGEGCVLPNWRPA